MWAGRPLELGTEPGVGRGGRRAATTLSYCTSLPRCPEISCSLLLPDYLCALCRLCCWDSPSVHCGHCCQCALMSVLAKELNFLFFLFSVKRFKQNLWLVLPCWALGFPQHCPSLCAETAGERGQSASLLGKVAMVTSCW